MSHISTHAVGQRAEERDPFEGTSYRAVRQLSEPGQSEMFVVAHRVTGRQFNAKLGPLGSADPQSVERMRIEAQALGRLAHPNIISIASIGRTSDQRFVIVTEYLEGASLAEEVRARGAIPLLEAVRYASELLSALSAAHSLGVVHRAVNPQAIFICRAPDGRRSVKLRDFGLVRVLPDAPEAAPAPLDLPTDSGVVLGVPGFVSPEVASGLRADARSDVYSAALVLYFMLTGRELFDDLNGPAQRSAATSIYALVSNASEAPVPRELERVLLMALNPDPGERLQTAEDFRLALDRIADALVRPAAWLETTTRAPLAPEEAARVRKTPHAAPADSVCIADGSEVPLPSGEATPLFGAAASEGGKPTLDADADERRRKLVLLFQLTALISGAIAGLVTFLLEGGLR